MVKSKKVAVRYANIFLAQAIRDGVVEIINRDVSFLTNQFQDNPTLNDLLNNPTLSRSSKRGLLKDIAHANLSPMVWRFIVIIIEQHQIGLLQDILAAFPIAYNGHMGIQPAILTTAVALPKSLIKPMMQEVQKWVPCKEVRITECIDPSIIGGYMLQIGTLKIDRSIKNYLNRLQAVLH